MIDDQLIENSQKDQDDGTNRVPLIPTWSNDQAMDSSDHTVSETNQGVENNQENVPSYNSNYLKSNVEKYDFSNAKCVKTLDRILDDLRTDPLFLLNNKNGILLSPTHVYSSELARLVENSLYGYEAVFCKTADIELSSSQVMKLDDNYNISDFSGLLVPKKYNSLKLSDHKIYHYNVKIKYPNNAIHVKNTFYGFSDNQLLEEDRLSIDAETLATESMDISSENLTYLVKSLPCLVDSANFISKETGILIRVEISQAIMGPEELELFDLTEIETRIATFNSQSPLTFEKGALTPNDCFSKLKLALTGALKHKDDAEMKSIDLQSTKLQVILDVELMMNKFFFTVTEKSESCQMAPIQFSSLGEYRFLCEEYYKRAITESVYYLSLTSPNRGDYKLQFSDSFDDIFNVIKEYDVATQMMRWNNWNNQFYAESMILLSSSPYYSDQLIMHLYETLVRFDSVNTPLYLDALYYCATSRNSESLPYNVVLLKDRGYIGFAELQGAFHGLGFNDATTCGMFAQITDDQVLSSYQNQIILAFNKEEKIGLRENLNKIARYRSSNMLITYLNTEPFFEIEDAYNLLEISPSVDDSSMIMFYDFKMSEINNFDISYARAFYTIVINRRSIVLLNYIENNLPQFSPRQVTLEFAYEYIGCTSTADDMMIVRIFQERLNKDTGIDFPTLWRCLKVIANYRQSKLLEGFLSTGMIDSTFLRLDQSPAGLNNIGNTCYLNSLLQYYFVIKPLRDYILNFNNVFSVSTFEEDEKYSQRRIGGRNVGLKETERSFQFMYQLRDLYSQLIHENERCVTPTRELAYLAFSPISFEVEFELEAEEEENKNEEEFTLVDANDDIEEFEVLKKQKTVDLDCDENSKSDDQLQFTENADTKSIVSLKSGKSLLIAKERKNAAAVCKISADQFESAFEIGSQQDVTECISNVLTQIESAMVPHALDDQNEQQDIIKELFYGKTKQRLVPVDTITKEEIPNGNVRTKLESFLNLIVNIGDHPKDIYDALDTFFTEDILELEDGEVKRSLTITELPKILQIQIQRVQFDRVRLMPVKSNDPIPFSDKLYMDRYLETEDEQLITKRKEIFHWRRRVEELNLELANIQACNEQGMTVRDALKTTQSYLQSETVRELGISVDDNTMAVLDSEIKRLSAATVSINSELEELQNKISTQFDNFQKVGYSIFAIFIHRGQASYGHYFIYIRDPKSNVYRKYNDEIVSEVSIEEIYNFAEGNTSTPYYLTFVKDELLDDITPLQRDILVNDTLAELNDNQMNVD